MLCWDVHEEQDHYLDLHLLHHLHLLSEKEWYIHRSLPHQPYDDYLRDCHYLHDATACPAPDLMICMLYNKNMWFKQAASSVWNATKSMLSDQRSPGKRLLD